MMAWRRSRQYLNPYPYYSFVLEGVEWCSYTSDTLLIAPVSLPRNRYSHALCPLHADSEASLRSTLRGRRAGYFGDGTITATAASRDRIFPLYGPAAGYLRTCAPLRCTRENDERRTDGDTRAGERERELRERGGTRLPACHSREVPLLSLCRSLYAPLYSHRAHCTYACTKLPGRLWDASPDDALLDLLLCSSLLRLLLLPSSQMHIAL